MKPDWLLAGTLALAACAPTQVFPPELAPEYVTRRTAKFYLYGPQQPGRPEPLPKETYVRLQREEHGFSVVQLADGRSGYVATEDIRLAPPSARAVSEAELFPERFEPPPEMPEPDLTTPVSDVPSLAAP